jgi:hypothetical protein
VDADAGAKATEAAEALASRMDPPSASIAPTTPATTPSRTIVASHAPRAPIAMDAPRRFARVLFLRGVALLNRRRKIVSYKWRTKLFWN